jgi:hypothetical protein
MRGGLPVFAYCRLFFSADIDIIRNEESIIKQLRKRWNTWKELVATFWELLGIWT